MFYVIHANTPCHGCQGAALQGLPLKNLAPLGSRPLLAWALQSILEFGKFDSVWVSTDHRGIAECAAACGAKVN